MAKYAESTNVSSKQSRDEIERILIKYGADQFMYGWQDNKALIGFRAWERQIKFLLPLPDRNSDDIVLTPERRVIRSEEQQQKAYEQAVRQKWRALALVIKAKLEAVEAGITVFDDEFLAHIVLPDGSTTGDFMRPQLQVAYETGQMPPLIPQLEGGGL